MNTLMTMMDKSFTGAVSVQWAPLVITGQTGCGKTTAVQLFAASFGAKIAFMTTDSPRDTFDPTVDWDAIDALVIDEINGWERKSLRDALPVLFEEARGRQKGIILVGQSVADIADLLPPETFRVTPTAMARFAA